MNTDTANYRSAKIPGRTAVQEGDTLTVFQGLEIIKTGTVEIVELTPGEIWEFIHTAEIPEQVEEIPEQVEEIPEQVEEIPVEVEEIPVEVEVPKMQISKRFAVEAYRLRGTARRPSDLVETHARWINGAKFDFTRIRWADGWVTVRATPYGSTEILHEWISRSRG
jgi:hypothetical protein